MAVIDRRRDAAATLARDACGDPPRRREQEMA